MATKLQFGLWQIRRGVSYSIPSRYMQVFSGTSFNSLRQMVTWRQGWTLLPTLMCLLWFSARDVEFCKKLTTAEEVQEAMTGWTMERSLGPDGLLYELYCQMPDLFGNLLADVNCKRQENGRIPHTAKTGVVVLLRKTQTKGIILITFDP